MDREVAAGWYDYMMPDTEFKFRNFTRNIPRESFDSVLNSSRSSMLSSSERSSIITLRDETLKLCDSEAD